MNIDDMFSDGDRFELETMLAKAAQERPSASRYRLVTDVLRPRLVETMGVERAKAAARWLLRNIDPANDIPPEEYLEVLGELSRLVDIVEIHVDVSKLTEAERVTLALAHTLASLHDLTEQWKQG